MEPRFCFILPLISRVRAKDWPLVCALCRRTVGSILQQEAAEHVRIILVGNDVPEGLPQDPRITLVMRDFPLPEKGLAMRDKGRKVEWGLTVARDLGATHVMVSDADDLVSRRLVSRILRDDKSLGWTISRGYFYAEGDDGMITENDFNRFCGTSAAHRVTIDELPRNEEEAATNFIAYWGHTKIQEYCLKNRMPHTFLNFRAAVYVNEPMVNDSGFSYHRMKSKRWLLRKIFCRHRLTAARRAEFNLYPLEVR